ncbi:MAG: DNA mismatch repair protein MutS [Tannerellaceae bacterium]|jgi:hypothetical protein|nr:DNA mismatch repair protein MutS [Tannerellaceae bacterium]
MEEVIAWYESVAAECETRAGRLHRRIHTIGTVRLLLVAAAIAVIWKLWGSDWLILLGATLVFAVPLVLLFIYHDKLAVAKEREEIRINLCRNELKAINYDFSAFDGAPERINAEHPFAADLDMFGDYSIFRSMNRTVTFMGKKQLALWLENPLRQKAEILQRQEAVRELSQATTLRHDFFVEGSMSRGKSGDVDLLNRLANMPKVFSLRSFWTWIARIVPFAWLILITGLGFGYVSASIIGLAFSICALAAYCRIKDLNALHNTVGQMETILGSYAGLMKIAEQSALASPLACRLRERLTANGITASQAIRRLSSHIAALDQRGTFTGVLFNLFTLREISAAIAIEKWTVAHGASLARWLDALGSFDALSSLAGFGFNHPDYIYPEIADTYFNISGKALGHPLIRRQACVTNDISIDRSPMFLIITGANMAGKSTWLRTVAVNFVLAATGAPVCAAQLAVYPARLVTGLRTSDSLAGNESYFFAELKRLKTIIDALRQGERLFIILDEILKGTNSVDKQRGSLALVRQLVGMNSCGIIATHDLALGSLAGEFPNEVANYCFEAEITAGRLAFDYLLRQGVACNMNASFLMQKMGITI